ncbi:hypothetical protein [Paenibacillus bouchesdurhonensis]|uniref:hypothetical protein n=1 Tax=Paenibacillus bouchesdurhonensis TaxID=1870990 RepID=UPI000FAC8DB8|nr:hypothetical protein [Paenibacillus bouchesdurhonensis]
MKIIITLSEAMEKGIWQKVMEAFGLDQDHEVWEKEQFILTEEQAREFGLIR